MNAARGGVAHHLWQVPMSQRFAPNEEQVTDVVFPRNVDHVAGLLQSDTAALFGIEPIHGEAAEIAFGVTDVGDGELEIAGAAVLEHVAHQPPELAFAFRPARRKRAGGGGRRNALSPGRPGRRRQRDGTHGANGIILSGESPLWQSFLFDTVPKVVTLSTTIDPIYAHHSLAFCRCRRGRLFWLRRPREQVRT